MKKISLIFLFICFFIISGCGNDSMNNSYTANEGNTTVQTTKTNKKFNYITIKYRDTSVDVSNFLTTSTSSSSFIEKAYYDPDNQYLILNLNGTYYHRCNVPQYVRNDFKNSDSLGKYYNTYIRGEYDCRLGYVPVYD